MDMGRCYHRDHRYGDGSSLGSRYNKRMVVMTGNQELKYLQMAVNLCNAHIANPQMPAEHGLREIKGYLERVIEHKKTENPDITGVPI
jgi:hypothetical protein